MVTLKALVDYTNTLLSIDSFSDYCPNGLQVEGRPDITKLVTGVTASLALIEAAIEADADVLLVHHGYFWKGEDACITGMKRKRIQQLLNSETSLIAYHLPLDAHPELGNNAQLALRLGIEPQGNFGDDGGLKLALQGQLAQTMTAMDLGTLIEARLGRAPLHIAGNATNVSRVGWCTGAAQCYLESAAMQGLDAFISGEISEQTVHVARELGIHYFSAGHHATERYGVQALGKYLAAQFSLQHQFIDVDNPV